MTVRVFCAILTIAAGLYILIHGAKHNSTVEIVGGVGFIAGGIGLVTP